MKHITFVAQSHLATYWTIDTACQMLGIDVLMANQCISNGNGATISKLAQNRYKVTQKAFHPDRTMKIQVRPANANDTWTYPFTFHAAILLKWIALWMEAAAEALQDLSSLPNFDATAPNNGCIPTLSIVAATCSCCQSPGIHPCSCEDPIASNTSSSGSSGSTNTNITIVAYPNSTITDDQHVAARSICSGRHASAGPQPSQQSTRSASGRSHTGNRNRSRRSRRNVDPAPSSPPIPGSTRPRNRAHIHRWENAHEDLKEVTAQALPLYTYACQLISQLRGSLTQFDVRIEPLFQELLEYFSRQQQWTSTSERETVEHWKKIITKFYESFCKEHRLLMNILTRTLVKWNKLQVKMSSLTADTIRLSMGQSVHNFARQRSNFEKQARNKRRNLQKIHTQGTSSSFLIRAYKESLDDWMDMFMNTIRKKSPGQEISSPPVSHQSSHQSPSSHLQPSISTPAPESSTGRWEVGDIVIVYCIPNETTVSRRNKGKPTPFLYRVLAIPMNHVDVSSSEDIIVLQLFKLMKKWTKKPDSCDWRKKSYHRLSSELEEYPANLLTSLTRDHDFCQSEDFSVNDVRANSNVAIDINLGNFALPSEHNAASASSFANSSPPASPSVSSSEQAPSSTEDFVSSSQENSDVQPLRHQRNSPSPSLPSSSGSDEEPSSSDEEKHSDSDMEEVEIRIPLHQLMTGSWFDGFSFSESILESNVEDQDPFDVADQMAINLMTLATFSRIPTDDPNFHTFFVDRISSYWKDLSHSNDVDIRLCHLCAINDISLPIRNDINLDLKQGRRQSYPPIGELQHTNIVWQQRIDSAPIDTFQHIVSRAILSLIARCNQFRTDIIFSQAWRSQSLTLTFRKRRMATSSPPPFRTSFHANGSVFKWQQRYAKYGTPFRQVIFLNIPYSVLSLRPHLEDWFVVHKDSMKTWLDVHTESMISSNTECMLATVGLLTKIFPPQQDEANIPIFHLRTSRIVKMGKDWITECISPSDQDLEDQISTYLSHTIRDKLSLSLGILLQSENKMKKEELKSIQNAWEKIMNRLATNITLEAQVEEQPAPMPPPPPPPQSSSLPQSDMDTSTPDIVHSVPSTDPGNNGSLNPNVQQSNDTDPPTARASLVQQIRNNGWNGLDTDNMSLEQLEISATRRRAPETPSPETMASLGWGLTAAEGNWGVIDELPLSICGINASMPTIKDVYLRDRFMWGKALHMVTSRLANALISGTLYEAERMLKWFLVLPRLLLRSPGGAGRRRTRMNKVNQRLRRFTNGELGLLLRELDQEAAKSSNSSGPRTTNEKKIINQALELARDMQYSKAISLLLSNGIADMGTHQIMEQLRKKHPTRKAGINSYPIDNYNPIPIDFEEIIGNSSRFKAADLNGNRAEFFFRAVSVSQFGQQICKNLDILANHFVYGHLPDHMKTVLNNGLLIALKKKKDPDPLPLDYVPPVRPITIGGMVQSMISQSIANTFKHKLRDHIEPLNLAATQNGIELLTLQMNEFLHYHKGKKTLVMGCLDASNFFNSVELGGEKGAFETIDGIPSMRDMIPACMALVENGGKLFSRSTDGKLKPCDFILESGWRQGNALSMAGAVLSFHPLLVKANDILKTNGQPGILRAFADNVYMIGTVENIFQAIDFLRKEMQENLSISLNPAESVVYAPLSVTQQVSSSAEQHARDRSFSFNRQGCKVVGIFIGEPESQKYYVRNRVHEAATKIKYIHDVVAHVHSQTYFHLSRLCAAPLVDFLLRAISPGITRDLVSTFDDTISDLLLHSLRIPKNEVDAVLSIRLRLPARHHGLAHRRRDLTCYVAFIAGMMAATTRLLPHSGPTGTPQPGLCPELEEFYGQDSLSPHLPQCMKGFLNPLTGTRSPAADAALEAWKSLKDLYPDSKIFNEPLTSVPYDPKFQKSITSICDLIEFKRAKELAKSAVYDPDNGLFTSCIFTHPDWVLGVQGGSISDIMIAGGPTRELFLSNFQWWHSIQRWFGVKLSSLRNLFDADNPPHYSWFPRNPRTSDRTLRSRLLRPHGAGLSCASMDSKSGPHDTLLNTILAMLDEVYPGTAYPEFDSLFSDILSGLKRTNLNKYNKVTSQGKKYKKWLHDGSNMLDNRTLIYRPDIFQYLNGDNYGYGRLFEMKTMWFSKSVFFGHKNKRVAPHPRAIQKFKQGYNDWMCDQDARLFPHEYGNHGTLDTRGDVSTPDRPIGPLERRFYNVQKSIFLVTEMGAINVPVLMFFKELAKKTSAEVAGNWNIQRGNTVRYTAESQISFQLRRRLAGNMTRSFANHFARRTVYIGSRNPSQHHRRQVFVDRNELHFDSAEHSVLDEEPLNSAEYAQRRKPFRSDRGLGERRV